MILKPHPHREGEQVGEPLLESVVAGELAADVADHPAQSDAQKFERAPRPLELVGMGVAPDHDCRPLGDPHIALAQWHAIAVRQRDQLFERSMTQPRIGRMGNRFWLNRGVDHHPFEILGRQCPGLVRHRQALLDQHHQLRLAQALAPMGQ